MSVVSRLRSRISSVGIAVLGEERYDRVRAALFRNPQFVSYVLVRALRGNPAVTWPQSIFQFRSSAPLRPRDLPAALSELGFCVHQGEHSVYAHGHEGIRTLCPELLEVYHPPFGLKFLLSSHVAPDGTHYVTAPENEPSTTPFIMRATGSARDKTIISNVLALRGLAPRVQDTVLLSHPSTPPMSVMITEHCGHDEPDGDEGSSFVATVREGAAQAGIDVLGPGFDQADFWPPTFRHNILRSPRGLRYVDVQNFAFRDYQSALGKVLDGAADRGHFGDKVPFRGSRYAYQSLPMLGKIGKRDTAARGTLIEGLLAEVGCSLEKARVLDVGCNLGVMCAYLLHRGAAWCTGLDTPDVAEVTRPLFSLLGYSRFDVLGCDLRYESPVGRLESRCFDVVLYLSIAHHIGFPAWLHELEWRFLVFEGPESASLADCEAQVRSAWPGARTVRGVVARDGDSAPRPVIVLASQAQTTAP